MTEKQFYIDTIDGGESVLSDNGKELSLNETCNLLNELVEENQRLKKELDRLHEENGYLKKEVGYLENKDRSNRLERIRMINQMMYR